MFEKFGHDFYINFIKDDRYTWLLDGLKNTMIITVFALLIGICIGFLVAIIRSSHDKSGNFKIANSICRVYLTDPWNTYCDPASDHELCSFWFCKRQ